MRAKLADLNHCAVPFFLAAPSPTCAGRILQNPANDLQLCHGALNTSDIAALNKRRLLCCAGVPA